MKLRIRSFKLLDASDLYRIEENEKILNNIIKFV